MSGLTGIVLNVGVGGASLGADYDGTNYYEIVKIGFSIAGATPVEVSTANPLPVVLTSANVVVNLAQYNGAAVGPGNAQYVQPGTAAVFPISASALPLPTGAATDAKLTSILAALGTPIQQTGGTVNQGTPAAIGNSWPTTVTDGVHGPAAVKVAGVAAVASDPALVVAVSPNNSVAVTGTFWQATQPVSAAALPLPANAALETGGNLAALVVALPPPAFFPPPSAFFGGP